MSDQSQHMAERLHTVAHKQGLFCCCNFSSHLPPNVTDATSIRGEKSEYLFDMTWYRDWTTWRLPDVIIEHECLGIKNEFLKDFWKLLFGYAPLRVMVGYAPNPQTVERFVQATYKHAGQAEWHFPNNVEDVVQIGCSFMLPRDFRVLHRKVGTSKFVDIGLINDMTFGPE